MEKTTVMIPSVLKKRVLDRARAEQVSFGELVRRGLDLLLRQNPEKLNEPDPLWEDTRVYGGPAPTDLAENHDRYLYGDKR